MKRYVSVCAAWAVLLAGACKRTVPQEITELVLSNCLAPVSLKTTVVDDYDVKFSWMVGKDADSYRLVVSTDAEISEVVCQETVLPSEIPYTVTLDPGVYYYKVQVLADDRGPSCWTYGEFRVKRPVCTAPGHLTVAVTNDNEAVFSWDKSREDDFYEFVMASDEEFSEDVETLSLKMDQVPYSKTMNDGVWYYKVRAHADRHDASEWTVCKEPLVIMKTVNLSDIQTANCYIVSEYGKYKFRTTKGNSSESVGQVASADVIWETSSETSSLSRNSIISSASIDEDGYISFLTSDPFKQGNALVAAKDANGKILWTWHIWCVSDSMRDVDLGNGIVLMDRNIGEVSVGDASYAGMLYQWGRKDPFPGTLTNGTSVAVAGTATGYVGGQVEGPSVTIENPHVIYGDKSIDTEGARPYFLGKGKIDNIASGDYDFWGSVAGGEKTIYDPCPAGYRVPHAWEEKILDENSLSKSRFAFMSGLEYNGVFGLTMDNGAVLDFRPSGYILLNTSIDRLGMVSESVQCETASFCLWTASRTNKRIAACIHVSNGDNVVADLWAKSGDNKAVYQAKNNAYPVRCEKIQ